MTHLASTNTDNSSSTVINEGVFTFTSNLGRTYFSTVNVYKEQLFVFFLLSDSLLNI